MRRSIGVLAVLCLSLALPAEAIADMWFSGKTGQGRTVKLRTSDEGLVERFGISWRADCRKPRTVLTGGTKTTPRSPFEVHTRDRFVDVGGYRERLDTNDERAVYSARTAGRRVGERRWRGIFRITARVFRGSRQVDRCHLRTRWRVTLRRQGPG